MKEQAAKVCRTCLEEISDENQCFSAGADVSFREKLHELVPGVNFGVTSNPVLCKDCVATVEAAHNFKKKCCLETEQHIQKYLGVTPSRGSEDRINRVRQYKLQQSNCRPSNLDVKLECIDLTEDEPETTPKIKDDGETEAKGQLPEMVDFNSALFNTNPETIVNEFEAFLNAAEAQHTDILDTVDNENIDLQNGAYLCVKCGLILTSEGEIIAHVTMHDPGSSINLENPFYKCHQSESSRNESEPTPHKTPQMARRKTQKKSRVSGSIYKCCMCNYSCKFKHSLSTHTRRHTGEKPYKCTMCEHRTRHLANMQVHFKINHVGFKFYKCDVCPNSYDLKRELNAHKKTHIGKELLNKKQSQGRRGGRAYRCHACAYAGPSRLSLINHEKVHSERFRYKCPQCPYTTFLEWRFVKHLKNHISEQMTDNA